MSSFHIDVILNEVKDLVLVNPGEMLHCVQFDGREICELNYDAAYSNLATNSKNCSRSIGLEIKPSGGGT